MIKTIEFVRRIQQQEGSAECFRTKETCDEENYCCWAPYCVGALKHVNNSRLLIQTYLLNGGTITAIEQARWWEENDC